MFLPLGLGHFVQKIPYTIIVLVILNIAFSHYKFKDVEKFDKGLPPLMATEEFKTASLAFQAKFCADMKKGSSPDYCLYLNLLKPKKVENKEKIKAPPPDQKYSKKLITAFFIQLETYKYPDEVLNSEELKTLMAIKKKNDIEVFKFVKSTNLLSPKSYNFFDVIKAGFTHAGLMHLYGNLFVIIVFGIYVEQRIGSLNTAGIFLTGSALGLWAQVVTSSAYSIMGASAGGTTLVGLFVVFFWSARMKFWYNFMFVYNKTYFFPVSITVPLMYIASDFIMNFSQKGTGVAYLAHSVGTLTGISYALYIRHRDKLPKHFLYNEEIDLLKSAIHTKNVAVKIKTYKMIRKWNNQNFFVFHYMLKEINKETLPLTSTVQEELGTWTKDYLDYYSRGQKNIQKYKLIKSVYKIFDLEKSLGSQNWQNLQKIGDIAFHKKDYELSLFIYKVAANKAKGSKRTNLMKTCNNIEEYLNDTEEVLYG